VHSEQSPQLMRGPLGAASHLTYQYLPYMLRTGLATQTELRTLHDTQLVTKIDQMLEGVLSPEHLLIAQMYRDELLRRDQQKSNDAMLAYTKEMNAMTKQIRNLTIVILAATLVTLVISIWPR
jgi:hypothetical protein